MTSLNFMLSRTAARGFRPGDEILVTALDHDGGVAPWLELAHDAGPAIPRLR
jgi:selenocysteine lyase/cysteine desulfurase